ncbi:hypothetical protein AAFF_G00394100 [Aldrovandia affinis]|uniref:Uncharacterized protein n=1 Tax=Aldrovandia affinis TaxID=143900 RepID=A0AAD7SFT4_9TELE|nr:hypothetical protein AAFF_G00394100 [Aldrovandia affinis]
MMAGVLKSLQVPLLVGQNCPGLDRLYASAVRKMHGTQLRAASTAPPTPVVDSPRPPGYEQPDQEPHQLPAGTVLASLSWLSGPWMMTVLTEMGKDCLYSTVIPGSPEEAARDLLNYSQELMPQQLQQTDVFSVQSGCTTVIQHHIETAPGVKVHIHLYRVPTA